MSSDNPPCREAAQFVSDLEAELRRLRDSTPGRMPVDRGAPSGTGHHAKIELSGSERFSGALPVDDRHSGPEAVSPPAGGHRRGGVFNLYTPHIPSSVLPLFDTEQPSGPTNRVVIRDYGDGVLEGVIVPQESPPKAPKKSSRESKTRFDMSPEQLERCAIRAKKMVREKCLMLGADRMFTLTYRENMQDRDLAYKHLEKFARFCNKQFGDFPYVAVMEYQKRGACHFHIATNRFFNVAIMRCLWHRASKDTGAVNVTSPRTGGKWNRVKISRYLAKYMLKDQEAGGINTKRFSSSRGIPKPVVSTYYIPLGPNTFRLVCALMRELSGKKIERFREVPLGTKPGVWLSTF